MAVYFATSQFQTLNCGIQPTESSIVITAEPDAAEQVRAALRAGLEEFNAQFAPASEFLPLTLTARNSDNQLIGGLTGQMRPGWGWLYLDMLWVAAAYRRQGIGQRLMRAAENHAQQHGCAYATVRTVSFQAPGFYEKLGYTVFGVQDNHPPGHRWLFFSKQLV